ncbi:cytochrome P450 6g1-like [Copidosoma floridanum]|uniref:cytochrome P450 6g1-like n=1 Tax=Copidosoma floridanum TaxID=29053 RepID=UPI0006C9B2F6|nr:cytochrome P450 6g1-like [Copidosoma floridanum]
MYLVALFFVVTVLLSVYLYLIRNYNYWKKQNIPCAPKPIPGVGHALTVLMARENMAMWAERMYKLMGKHSMFGCYFVQKPALLIRDPELIKTILQTNFSSFRNNLSTLHKDLDPILYKNSFFAKDELWKESRTILGNNFSGKTLRSVFAILCRVCDEFTVYVNEKIKSGIVDFELKDLSVKISGELVANAAFGIEGQSFKDNPDRDAFTEVAKRAFGMGMSNGLENALRFCFPSLATKIGVRLLPKETDLYFRQIIRTIIKTRVKKNESNSDFLQFIVDRMHEIDEDMALAQATSIFFDGYETSSSVLSFVVYRLAEHPSVQEMAREEIYSVLKKWNNKLTYESVKEMRYLEQVVCEVMRLNPGLGELIKICNEEVTMQGKDGLKCTLKPGSLVVLSAMGIHMDDEFWHDPQVFDPERFSPARRSKVNKYSYLAFGEGPRVCIGKRMAMMTVKMAAAVILKNYLLEVALMMTLPIKMNPNTFAWVAKDGLWVRFKHLRV